MSEALNQTISGNTNQVQGSEVVDTQSNEYLEARQAFFDGVDNPTTQKQEEPVVNEHTPEPIQDEQIQQKGEQDNGLQQEEVLNNQTQEVVDEPIDEKAEDSVKESSTDEPTKPKQKRQYKVKANGEEFDVSFDEMRLLASKGINYTQKLQKLSPFRKMLSAIEDAGITETEINQFIEMRKGNKDAIGAFTKKHNIALSDIEEGERAENYQPQQYGREQTPLNDIDEKLYSSMSRGNYNRMVNFFNNELDKPSVQFFMDNPEALRILANDIETGIFDVIRKEIRLGETTDRYKAGVSFMDKYRYEAIQMEEARKQQQQAKQQPSLGQQKQEVDKTKLGATGTKNVPDKTQKVINSLEEIDDDDYIAWKKKLMI